MIVKIKHFVILLGVLSIFILVGCAQQQTKYVCPDGSTVSDASLCPKKNAKLIDIGNNGIFHSCIDEAGTHTLLDECLSETKGIHRNFYVRSDDFTICRTSIDTFECGVGGTAGNKCYLDDGVDAGCT